MSSPPDEKEESHSLNEPPKHSPEQNEDEKTEEDCGTKTEDEKAIVDDDGECRYDEQSSTSSTRPYSLAGPSSSQAELSLMPATTSPPSSQYKVIKNSAGLGAKRRPQSPIGRQFAKLFPRLASSHENDPGPSNRYSIGSNSNVPGPSGVASSSGALGGDDSSDALSLFELLHAPSPSEDDDDDEETNALELGRLQNKMMASQVNSFFAGPSSAPAENDSGVMANNSEGAGTAGSNIDYLLSLLPPTVTPVDQGYEVPLEDPIIIRGNGNMTLFGLSNSFSGTFPTNLLGRVSREEFDFTIGRINNLLGQQHSTNAKFLLLGCLCCCCSLGCSVLWPTLALSRRTRNSLEKVLAMENSRLYNKLGLNWRLSKQQCHTNHTFMEYILLIEFLPKLQIYQPD